MAKIEEEDELLIDKGESEGKREALRVAEEARQKEWRQPSFGGKLFLGQFDLSLVHPFPEQSDEDKREGDAFIEELAQFLEENLDPEEVDKTREIPEKVIKGMAERGIFAMKIPKEYGGLGFSQTNYNRAVMKVASYCGATAVLISAHQSIGVPQPLLMYGTEEQKRKFFPRFRQGAISAFALTEIDVGSDPAQMSSTAELSSNGSHYILNGTKLWCTNGTIADIIVVMAKTAPKMVKGKERQQISAFILEMDSPGVEVLHRCEFMGLNGIYNGVIKFTNVKIPKENLIWEEGRGLAMALGTINVGRLTLPAASAGAAKQLLSIARRFGKERVQWGQAVGMHETGREKIAFIASSTFAIEAVTWLTSHWADQKKVDIRIEAAMAKLFATETLWKISDATMQLRGGRGYETARSLRARGEPPYAVERAMRDCRINMILEGTSEIMKLFLAREAMDPHLTRAAPLLKRGASFFKKLFTGVKLFGHYLFWYPKLFFKNPFGPSYSELGELADHYRFVEKQSRHLARKLFTLMARYRQRLERKQMLLGRLMEAGTDLFVMTAVCSYAVHRVKKNPEDRSPIALADYFCRLARRRIEGRFSALNDNDDAKANALAKRVLSQEMQWLEEGIIWVGPDL